MIVPLYSVSIPRGVGEKVEAVLQSGRIASGEYVLQFEEQLRGFIENPLLIATGDMSTSLVMSLYLAGVRPDDEVVASPMACLATNAPIRNLFARVKWCDCDPDTGAMDPDSLKGALSLKTKAILVNHWAGNPADLSPIYDVARSEGIPVVEDASEALGAEYCEKKLGNTGGDFVVYSFYPNRHLTTVEGAAIAFKDPALFERCRWLRRYGIHAPSFRTDEGEINPFSDIPEAGWNSYMNQVSAVVGLSQMGTLRERLAIHQSNGQFYDGVFRNLECVSPLRRPSRTKSAYWVYTLLTSDRERLSQYLSRHGVQTSRVHIRNDIYSCFETQASDLPGVAEFSRRALSIPSGWWVSPEQRDWIAELIVSFR